MRSWLVGNDGSYDHTEDITTTAVNIPMEAKEVGNRLNLFCDRITKLRKSKSTRRYGSLKMDKTAGQ